MRFISASTKLLLSLAILLLPLNIDTAKVDALSGSEFMPGRIIDDAVFYDSSSMSVQQIQEFLNAKVPVCDTNGTQPIYGTTRAAYGASVGHPAPFTCLKDYSQTVPAVTNGGSDLCKQSIAAGVKTAAQIIFDASRACGINPKVLIVLLQKEQSLITDDWPWDTQYRSATGYGCPDTAPCDAEYYGFFNQVYQAAKAFRRYEANPNSYNYKAKRNNTIYYNPNLSGCGSSNVFIENQATASLYIYTPYQPNAAALNNLYGSGDSCSAYGNRNFWRMYNDWFGKTTFTTTLQGRPSVVVQTPGQSDSFARGQDGRLWQNWFDVGGWQTQWNYIDGPSSASSAPTAISWGDGHMDVFETRNGSLWHAWYLNDSIGWRSWTPLGNPGGVTLSGSVAAVAQKSGKINIFVRGSDGRLWQNWFDVGGWQTQWNYIDGPSSASSAPTAISWGDGHMDVFETRNGSLWHAWYLNDSIGWRSWTPLGNPGGVTLSGSVAAVAQKSGKINIFVRGSDGRLWQNWFDVGGWQTQWNYIDGPSSASSAPTAISWGDGHMDVFETRNGSLWHAWYLNDSIGWRSWQPIGRP